MKAEKLLRRAPGREAKELGEISEHRARPQRARRLAEDRHLATAGPHQPTGNLHQRRLPSSVGPQQADQLASFDLEIDPRQSLLAAVGLAQVLGQQSRRHQPSGSIFGKSGATARTDWPPPREPSSASSRVFASAASSVSPVARQVGDEQQRRHPQALDQAVEDLVEALGVGLILGQLPRLRLLHVAIEPPHQPPGLLQRLGQLGPVQQLAEARHHALEVLGEHGVERRPAGTTPAR